MTEKKFDENYWKDKLSSEQFYITRKGGTERPFSGKYLDNKENGIYVCVCCETELFDSDKSITVTLVGQVLLNLYLTI